MRTFEQPELVEFFSGRRNRPEDIYPSERRFLPELAARAESVLDVGCAVGGFADIWHAFSPELRYTGVDVSEALVAAARKLHPGDAFLVGDCADGLQLPDRAADVVSALGWLHWEPRYRDALRELWRLAGQALFFDVRLHAGKGDIVGRQDVPGGETPYLCISWPEFRPLLAELAPGSILAYGYTGPPAESVSGIEPEVVFAAFVLERGGPPTEYALELPFSNEGVNG